MGTTGQSITLANSIIGVGILAMPFCFQQCGVLLATVILLFMGLVSRVCCYFLLKSALLARRRNFEFLAFHVFGSAGKLAVEIGIIGFLMGTCIAYFVVVGDLGPQIISKMFNINQSDMLRTSIMVIVSLVCVLPLGLLRNVDSLSNVSAATIGFYFCLVMKVITEAGSQMITTDWQSRVELWKPSGMLQCVPIFSMALFCQTQLFEIFESLPTLSLEKMNVVTKNAIHICAAVYFTLGLFGYIAFSSQDISGNILMSLSPTMANDVIKLGFVMSVAFSFPLIIFPCRASLYSLLYKKVHSSHHDHIINHSIPESSFRCITVAIVGVALFISLLLPNIELVLGLVGSTIGVLICVVFPAACFVNVTFKNTNERVLAKAVLVLGLIIMVLGTYANLQAAENQLDKYDDKYITKERIDKIVEDFFEKMEKSDALKKQDIVIDNNLESNKLNEEVIKESVIQPPNPVPPESQSNEKNVNNADVKDNPKLKEILPEPEKESVDKVSETHPKNLNKPNGAKEANGINENIELKNEKPKEEIKVQSNDEKINMIKQQQLIETIKQHGEEQKELIKEQKEILDEIMKTKQELQKNKNDAVNEEAKKIAVESIKKIANMAIQSLAGVSEKPGVDGVEKKSEQLEKLADEAVHEIAQKAVETIEAIKEIKEKPEPLANIPGVVESKVNNLNSAVVHNSDIISQNKLSNPNPIQESVQNNPAQQKSNVVQQPNNGETSSNGVLNVARSEEKPLQNLGQADSNVGQEASNVGLSASKVGQPADEINKPAKILGPENKNPNSAINIDSMPLIAKPEVKISPPTVNVVQPDVQSVGNQQNDNQNQNSDAQIASNIDLKIQPVQQVLNDNVHNNPKPIETVKEHSHSPDEPQSYKEGEDSLKKTQEQNSLNKIIAANVPLPLAMNGNMQTINQPKNNNNEAKPISNNVQNIAQNNEQSNNQETVIRQKREVVDCTEKMLLKTEDKEICNTLIDHPNKLDIKDKDILLAKVDFNNVGLPNKLPMQENILHHIRSLKSIDETNKNTR